VQRRLVAGGGQIQHGQWRKPQPRPDHRVGAGHPGGGPDQFAAKAQQPRPVGRVEARQQRVAGIGVTHGPVDEGNERTVHIEEEQHPRNFIADRGCRGNPMELPKIGMILSWYSISGVRDNGL
jgi:hypothetical protein